MTTRLAFHPLAAFALLAILARGDTASRIAVIGDVDNQNLAALVTTELSGHPEILLVERNDLARVGDELKLQQLAGSAAVALGKLVNANGLVFISKGAKGSKVRFTAVRLGYALFDDPAPVDFALPQEAKSIAHRVSDYVPKLNLDPIRAIPLSVLNLRATDNSAVSATLERDLTLLLESRLASVPEYVVLERRHAWSLEFERSLDPAARPLLQGAYLIDGSFNLARDGTGITIHFRLRSPAGADHDATASGLTSELPGLVEKLVTKIHQMTGARGALPEWPRAREAQEYLQEAIWARQHGTDEQTQQAIDSADLLGDTSPELMNVRMQTLCDRAGQGLEMSQGELPGPLPANSSTLDERADALLRAIELTRQGGSESRIIPTASKVLVLLDQSGSPRADELRRALRLLTHYDPLHGLLGAGGQLEILYYTRLYADEWSMSLEEELACYRCLCLAGGWLPPVLLAHGKDFCPRFLKTPDEQARTLDAFHQSLKTEPRARLAYLLIDSASPDHSVADPAFTAYIGELWKRREELTRADALRPEFNNARSLSPGANNSRPIADELFTRHASEMVPLLRYYLTHWSRTETGFALEFLWQADGWSEDEAAAIWPEYQQYRTRLVDYWKSKGNNLSALPFQLAKFEDPFRKKFPQIAEPGNSSTANAPLTVTRFWHPWLSPATPRTSIACRTWATSPDGLWLFGSSDLGKNFIYHIRLPDFQTEAIPLPEKAIFQQVRASSKALYIDYLALPGGTTHGLARYDLTRKSWEMRPIPFPFMGFYSIQDDLYFNLRVVEMTKGGESGLARYDWPLDKATILTDSRRKPAQNQFDDRNNSNGIASSQVQNVFAGPGGQACVNNTSGAFFLQDKPGNWQPVFDASYASQSVTENGETLLVTHDGEVVLLSPKKSDPEYLMSPRIPRFRRFPLDSAKETPSWIGKTSWDVPEHPEFSADGYCSDNIGYGHGQLFVLVAPSMAKAPYELLVYSKKTGRTPRHILLQFHLDPSTKTCLAPLFNGHDGPNWTVDPIDHPGTALFTLDLLPTEQGLCFHMYAAGVWFLPYQDIDSYLKSQPATAP